MKRGQTIAASREKLQSASERLQVREQQKRKKNFRLGLAISGAAIVVALLAADWYNLTQSSQNTAVQTEVATPQAEFVDEGGTNQISTRIKAYAAQLETDLADLGYKVVRITLPVDSNHVLYLDLEGQEPYFKVNLNRNTAVTAEDIDRMIRYLAERQIVPAEYVDVQVAGKAVYK